MQSNVIGIYHYNTYIENLPLADYKEDDGHHRDGFMVFCTRLAECKHHKWTSTSKRFAARSNFDVCDAVVADSSILEHYLDVKHN